MARACLVAVLAIVMAQGVLLVARAPSAAAAEGSTHVIADVQAWFPAGAGLHPVAPARILDTRDGTGGVAGPVTGRVDVMVSGVAGVPSSGVAAVVVNLTVTSPNGQGYVTAWPGGTPKPGTSSINFALGETVANLAVIGLGADGRVSLDSATTTVQLIVDVLGWLADDGGFMAVDPSRLLDTRFSSPVAAGSFIDVPVAGLAGVPESGARAVVLNLTATGPETGGYLVAYPSDAALPPTSNLNVAAGDTVANHVVVPLSDSGAVRIFTTTRTNVIVDVVGYFSAVSEFGALTPAARLLDSRSGVGTAGAFPSGGRIDLGVAGSGGVPADAATVVLNLTVTQPTGAGWLTVGPQGTVPPTSSVNFTGGQTVANLVVVGLDAGGISITGFVAPAPPPPPPPPALQPASPGARGSHVAELQRQLLAAGFWLSGVDSYYGNTTTQAVMAFQKYLGLRRTGVADQVTIDKLALFRLADARPVARARAGSHTQVDKTRQLLFVIRDGLVSWVVNVSTGSDQYYCATSRITGARICAWATTPEGVYAIYRQNGAGWVLGELGQIYRPKYVVGGVAIHGYNSVPGYPASHGCIRVSVPFMDAVWAFNLIPFGSTVWIYR